MAILTNAGKQWLVDKARATNGAATGVVQVQPNDTMKYIHWGTGVTAEAATQTALITAGSEARVAGVMSTPSAAVYRVVATITADGTKTIAEAGVFDQLATGGTMLIRAMFTGIPLVVGDQIQFTFDLTQA